ncbi:MAG: arginine repressor [Ruminococcus sp.]|nr:arginine repressor [Candidatus Copronaster equi]
MKKKRHSLILKLIETYVIGTQEEMLQKLKENGFDSTQATVSRDIKELRLVKQMDKDGNYRYVAGKSETEEYLSKFNAIFSHSVLSSDYAGNTVVIKCYPGMAQAACATFDNMKWEGLVGTLAGDDTIFALCRTEALAHELKDSIDNLVK